jgi:hypothetical protein
MLHAAGCRRAQTERPGRPRRAATRGSSWRIGAPVSFRLPSTKRATTLELICRAAQALARQGKATLSSS